MKTLQKLTWALTAVAAFLFLGNGTANAQQKLGYINSQELLSAMPETDSVQTKVVNLSKELEEQFTAMRNEYSTKAQDLANNLSTLSETIRKQKEKDLFDLQTRLEEFQQSAQQEIQSKQLEWIKPVMEKAQGAIAKVAKEQGMTAVFDLTSGALAYYNEAQMVNLLPLVKQSLGIK
ncbi:OmpH family outer membrane protein [uncultured Rikenella sp.]|uniref:OmpH family outer membrane protein n=1 Tax=uncultured Rikenella sp. TaxID=368003 RepID=UPI002607CB2F|nr:OmpH family outer membrane protein [uncultured Rikenella sp.]